MILKADSKIKTLPYYGSKDWANAVLRLTIQELKNTDRVISARQIEIFHFLHELESFGYWWQVARLRNHIHLAIKQDRFRFTAERSEADSRAEREEPSL
jgi:hypothetical protein